MSFSQSKKLPTFDLNIFQRTCPGLEGTYDIGAFEVWRQFQLFGSGVVVMIVDDGLSIHHSDLQHSYVSLFNKKREYRKIF